MTLLAYRYPDIIAENKTTPRIDNGQATVKSRPSDAQQAT